MLIAIPCLNHGRAEIELHHNIDHVVLIDRIWIWPEGKGPLEDQTFDVLSGNLVNLPPDTKKHLDVTQPVLRALSRSEANGMRIWIGFHLDPMGSLPAIGLYEIDIHEGRITKFARRN